MKNGLIKIFLLIVCFSWPLLTHANSFDIENLFNKDGFQEARLSPNGDYLSAIYNDKGKVKLIIFSLKDMKVVNLIAQTKERGAAIQNFVWLNNNKYMFDAAKKDLMTADGFIFTGRYVGDVLKNKRKTTWLDGIIDYLPKDPKFVLRTEWRAGYAKVCKHSIIHLNEYSCWIRTKGKYPEIITDRDHKVRISYSTEDDGFQHFWYKNLLTDKWEDLGVYHEDKGKVSPLEFSKDNSEILVMITDGSEKQGVYWLDTKTKKREVVYLFTSKFDIEDWIYDNDFDNPSIIGYTIEKDKVISIFFDESHKDAKRQRSLESLFKDESVKILDYTQDGNSALVLTYSEKNPGTLYLMDLKSNSMRYVLDYKPHIKAKEMYTTRSIKLDARDKLELHGYLTLPFNDEKKNQALPLIVKVHGGPYGVRDRWEFDAENQLMASKGYAVLQINYRGSSGYGFKFVNKAYRQMGAQMQDDVTDATLWAIEQGFADKNRICIYGFSYGGYAALMGAVKEPDLYKCAAPSAGVYDISLFQRFGRIQRSDFGEDFLKKAWGDSDEFYEERSPINHLDKLKAALFIMHGKKDEQVDFGQYEALIEKLDEIDYPYKTVVYDRERHSLYDVNNQKDYYNKLFTFFEKHIGK